MTRRILHISDLHFGRDRPELLRPLISAINDIAPDLVVVSGDFTQRARSSQFRAARAFLDRIEAPTLSVPGNHDTPLDNLAVRLIRPWARYRKHIDRDLEPVFEDDEIAVVGVNTANPLSWQRGRMRGHAVRRVCAAFDGHPHRRLNVAVLHHPLEHLPEIRKRLMRGASRALARMGECGADVILSGHLHTWRVEPFAAEQGVLLVQAGTGLSTRGKGEPNDFNVLTTENGLLSVARHIADPGSNRFRLARTTHFDKAQGVWRQRT